MRPPYGTTNNPWDVLIPFDELWEQYNRVAKPNAAIVLTAQTPFDKVLGMSNIKNLRYEWIWQKTKTTGFLNAKVAPLKEHENALVFYRKAPTYNPQMRTGFKPYSSEKDLTGVETSTNYGKQKGVIVTDNDGSRYPKSIIEFPHDVPSVHPTQKPVALMEYFIKTYTNEGEVVMDNTMGSGSTGVAAMRCKRRFIGFEMNPEYFDICRRRIEAASKGQLDPTTKEQPVFNKPQGKQRSLF